MSVRAVPANQRGSPALPGRGKEEWRITLVFTPRRRTDLSREEFQGYWCETHVPLVESRAEMLKIRRYVQIHARENGVNPLLGGPRGSESDYYDGVAEVWWDSLEEMKLAFTTEEGRAAGNGLHENDRDFEDLPNSPLWLGEENVVIEQRPARR